MSESLQPHRRQPTRLPHPWDSPGKNTGVGCHFRLQCMKVKSESEVAQSCPTLSDPMDCSLSGSSVHGILQARVLEWGAIAFSHPSVKPTKSYVSEKQKKLRFRVSMVEINAYSRIRKDFGNVLGAKGEVKMLKPLQSFYSHLNAKKWLKLEVQTLLPPTGKDSESTQVKFKIAIISSHFLSSYHSFSKLPLIYYYTGAVWFSLWNIRSNNINYD